MANDVHRTGDDLTVMGYPQPRSFAEIEPRFGFLDYRLAHGDPLVDEVIEDPVSTFHLNETLRQFNEETLHDGS